MSDRQNNYKCRICGVSFEAYNLNDAMDRHDEDPDVKHSFELEKEPRNPARVGTPDPSEFPLVRIYPPIEDWSGLGYEHWLITLQGGRPIDGVGESLMDAYEDLLEEIHLSEINRNA